MVINSYIKRAHLHGKTCAYLYILSIFEVTAEFNVHFLQFKYFVSGFSWPVFCSRKFWSYQVLIILSSDK